MRSTFDAQKRCFPIRLFIYTSIYKKVNDLGRPFSVGENKTSQVAEECRLVENYLEKQFHVMILLPNSRSKVHILIVSLL